MTDFSDIFAIDVERVRQFLPAIFQHAGYDSVGIEDAARTATARRQVQALDHFGTTSRLQAEIRWSVVPGARPATRLQWNVIDLTSGQRRPHPTRTEEFAQSIRFVLADAVGRPAQGPGIATQPPADAPLRDPVAGPGRPLEALFTGTFLDYSGCATENEVGDLLTGTLPLGRWAFGFQTPPQQTGPALYLSRFSNGAPMEYNGVLVCAPQNSGKTELVVRWAKAATRAARPQAVFVVDVKGNLRSKLAGELAGEVYCFSTDPLATDSDRINFLAGPRGLDAVDTDRIRQIATALLPSRGFAGQGGVDEFHYRNRVIWLTAFIHILKLAQFYQPGWFVDNAGDARDADLSDLYKLVASEDMLCDYWKDLQAEEGERRERNEPVPSRGIDQWIAELAIMLDKNRISIGQRPEKDSYQQYTIGIMAALEPFAEHGTLHSRIGSHGPGRLFDIEAVLGGAQRPVTVILAARQQDLDKAETVLALTIKRLQWFMFDRMSQADAANRPVFMLLDETRRIRDFDAAEHITFAREARVGCVVVYQSLDQVGPPAKVVELLENVGTQIYLGSLIGNTARHFQSVLPKRWRPAVARQVVRSASGEQVTLSYSNEQVDYLGSPELHHLPAGRWPALVLINDQPRRKPFLTDMSDASRLPRTQPLAPASAGAGAGATALTRSTP